MSILKDLQKSFKSHHLIALLGVVILIAALSQYSGRKGSSHEGADGAHHTPPEHLTAEERFAKESPPNSNSSMTLRRALLRKRQPANPQGQNELFASAGGLTTATTGLPQLHPPELQIRKSCSPAVTRTTNSLDST